MGLFNKKHDNANTLHKAAPATADDEFNTRQNAAPLGGSGAGVNQRDFAQQPATAGMTSDQAGYTQGMPHGQSGQHAHEKAQYQPSHPNLMTSEQQAGLGQQSYDQPQNQTMGMGAGAGYGQGQGQGQGQQHHGHHGHGGGMQGHAEQNVGGLVGSHALQEQSMQKEQELNTLRQQANALSEAERLEQEAMEARQRAVHHGAHQQNAQLGAGNQNVGF